MSQLQFVWPECELQSRSGPESVEIEAAAGRTFRFTFADASAHQAGACYSHHRSSLEEVSSFHKVEVRGVKLTILMK